MATAKSFLSRQNRFNHSKIILVTAKSFSPRKIIFNHGKYILYSHDLCSSYKMAGIRWPTTVTAKSFSSRQNHFNPRQNHFRHGKIILTTAKSFSTAAKSFSTKVNIFLYSRDLCSQGMGVNQLWRNGGLLTRSFETSRRCFAQTVGVPLNAS